MRFVTIDASPASRSATPTRSIPSATCCSAADRRPCTIAKMPATSTQYSTKGRRLSKQSSTRKRRKRKPDCTKERDRKSTRLNSSHGYISYAVFCLKKKKKTLEPGEPAGRPAVRAARPEDEWMSLVCRYALARL